MTERKTKKANDRETKTKKACEREKKQRERLATERATVADGNIAVVNDK